MTSSDSTPEEPVTRTDHSILEAFNAEETIDHPGELDEEPDPADDADAPAP
jgi:hypothetical protein